MEFNTNSACNQEKSFRNAKLNICLPNIPHELKVLPQWVGWRMEYNAKGKLTKIPKNPRTGGNALPNTPSTWGTIQEALIAVEKHDLEGIGFEFNKSDPYTGIDLDHSINPETGELEPWARRWVELFDSYNEVSPSGTGVHIIIKGKLPGKGRKEGNFEVYSKGRFFTMTGNKLNGSNGNRA